MCYSFFNLVSQASQARADNSGQYGCEAQVSNATTTSSSSMSTQQQQQQDCGYHASEAATPSSGYSSNTASPFMEDVNAIAFSPEAQLQPTSQDTLSPPGMVPRPPPQYMPPNDYCDASVVEYGGGSVSVSSNGSNYCARNQTPSPQYSSGGSYCAQQTPSPQYCMEAQQPYFKQDCYGSNGYDPYSGCYFNYPQTTEGLDGKPPNLSLQQTLCKVCNDTASGNHFGVLSCEACKSFFRRSIRASARYACRGSRSCAIEKHTRNRCQYCRLQKCLAIGMRKEAVQEERTPQGAKLQRASTPTPLGFQNLNFVPPAVPYFPQTFDSPTSPVPRMLTHAASRMYGSLPNLKMEFDRSSAHSPGMLTPHNNSRSFTPPLVDTSVSSSQISVSVLVNADMQSDSQPEVMKKQANNIKLEDLFEGIKASLLKVIEWSKRIPAFGNLSLDDQVKLLKSSWCEHCTLKLAAQNGPKSDTVLLANGISCNKDNIDDPEVRRVLFRIFNELAYWLDYLNVDRVELACLKGILLFNPDAKGLSASSKKKVEIFQEQILQSLESRTKTMYPVSPQRFSKLLLRLAPLKAISLEVMQHMEVQRALGNAKMDNLFGELLDFE